MALSELKFEQFETLNTGFPTEIPDNHFSDTLNMIRREDGLWENRKGIAQFGADVGSGEAIHSLRFWGTSGGGRYLSVGTDTDIYSYAEAAAYNDGTYTNRTTLGSSDPWDSVVYRDTIVLGNGTDDLETSTDNSTFTTRTAQAGPPLIVKAKYLEVGNDFVTFVDPDSNQDQVLLSGGAPNNPWEANASNVANIDIGNSDEITGIKSLGDVLVVCKKDQTYSVALSDFARNTLDWGGGTESNRAILQTQKNALFIASRQGIFDIAKQQIGDNQLFGSPESAPIKSLYDLIDDYSGINGLYTKRDNYAFWNASTTLGKLTFLRHLDFSKSVWSYFKGINAKDWATYLDSSGDPHYLFADGATDKVWELFTGRNDAGAPILSRLSSKRTDFGAPGIKKRVQYIDFYGYISKNATWNVEIYRDDNPSSPATTGVIDKDNLTSDFSFDGLGAAPLGTVPLGGKVATATGDIPVYPFAARIPVDTDFEKLQWSLWNNQADSRVILRSVVVYTDTQPLDLYDTANIL
jgi:hypothetical protein